MPRRPDGRDELIAWLRTDNAKWQQRYDSLVRDVLGGRFPGTLAIPPMAHPTIPSVSDNDATAATDAALAGVGEWHEQLPVGDGV